MTCGRACYEFDDGDNDPRGELGDHADSGFCAADNGYAKSLPDVAQCFPCANEEGSYKAGLARAIKRWEAKGARPLPRPPAPPREEPASEP